MTTLLACNFPAATAVLATLRDAVRAACRTAGCSDECGQQAVLAVNEACMNIIQHGYRLAGGGEFRIEIAADPDVLVVRLLDNGRPACASDLCPRELDDLRPGGLGVRFMREVTDSVAYLPPPPGFTNLLELRKRIY